MTSNFKEIQIQQVSGGVVNFGNSLSISPKSAIKEPTGGGSRNFGACIVTSTGFSCTNFVDPDGVDQKINNGFDKESILS
ncbi:spore germination protein [Bacillus sp. Bva_UNVM-123]|uniref:spore germination protein n=1 Tax=Bacillus sp. Bva_UNVM-123 TaxID=2829798 RepID=UPI00391F9A7F